MDYYDSIKNYLLYGVGKERFIDNTEWKLKRIWTFENISFQKESVQRIWISSDKFGMITINIKKYLVHHSKHRLSY